MIDSSIIMFKYGKREGRIMGKKNSYVTHGIIIGGVLSIALAISVGMYFYGKSSEKAKIVSIYKHKKDSIKNVYKAQLDSLEVEKQKELEALVK